MVALAFITVTLILFLQVSTRLALPDNILTLAEKLQLESQKKIENRVKVYESASKRIHRAIEEAISKDKFETLPANLQSWAALLEESVKDIEANLKPSKKPRPLIKYEIHLRKAITTTQKSKIRIPLDQEVVFNLCLSRAAAVHRKIVMILLHH